MCLCVLTILKFEVHYRPLYKPPPASDIWWSSLETQVPTQPAEHVRLASGRSAPYWDAFWFRLVNEELLDLLYFDFFVNYIRKPETVNCQPATQNDFLE